MHNAKRLIELVVDEGSFFPIAPLYGRARITGLARINGYPIGVMANDPMHNGGATDVAAGLKASRLTQLCDLFHLPLVDFADEAGLMVGLESEKQGIERAGARLVCITNACRMPWITIVIRRLYGVGGQTHHRATGMFRRYAWPSARWGSMHIAGGAAAAYRREVENADDPEAEAARDRGAPRPAGIAVPHRRGDRPGHHRSARHPAADRRLRGGRAARARRCSWARRRCSTCREGLRVVDLSTGIAGAYCARLFAATGGDVVVAEPAGGSPLRVAGPLVDVAGVGAVSPTWEYLGAGKRSVVTDPGDDETALELLRWADVVVLDHDGRPAEAAARVERISAANPAAVVTVLSGFGLDGPRAAWRSSPLGDWAASGHLYLTGDVDREPLQGGGPWDTYLHGAVAAVGTAAAAIHAARTGEGQVVDVSAIEALASMHQWTVTMYTHNGTVKRRWGNLLGESSHPVALYQCQDGEISIVAVNPQQWEALCIAMELWDLLADRRLDVIGERFDRAAEIDAQINQWLSTRTVDEAIALLAGARRAGQPAADDVAGAARGAAGPAPVPRRAGGRWARGPRCRGCRSASRTATVAVPRRPGARRRHRRGARPARRSAPGPSAARPPRRAHPRVRHRLGRSACGPLPRRLRCRRRQGRAPGDTRRAAA